MDTRQPDIMTWIYYLDKEANQTTICALYNLTTLLVGDIYNHKTHKTEFNKKIDSDVKDGEYVVTKREWVHHKANLYELSLHIFVEDTD